MEVTIISAGPVWAKIAGPAEGVRCVHEALTAKRKGWQFTKAAKHRGWDGNIHFLNRATHSFPTGLTMRAHEALRAAGFPHEIKLTYTRPPGHAIGDQLHGKVPRAHQERAADWACLAGRCSLQVGPGGGKTLTGAEIIRRFGLPTLWMVHTKDLMYQVQRELEAMLNEPVGIIGDGKTIIPKGCRVVVGIVNSLARIPESAPLWAWFLMVFLDECQLASNEMWYDVALRLECAVYRFGLSGTVETPDPARNMRLEGMTGPLHIVEGGSEVELIEQGLLDEPTIQLLRPPAGTFPAVNQVRDAVCPKWRENPRVLIRYGSRLFAEAYRRGIMENVERDLKFLSRAADRIITHGEKVMLMCARLDHGHRVHQAAEDIFTRKVPVAWLSGEESAATRVNTVKAFRKHEGGALLVVSKIFDAGVDIPEIDDLGLMGGGESSNTTFQRVGRALRRHSGHVWIWDSIDGIKPGGKDYLANHSLQRIKDYQSKGYTVELTGDEHDEFTALLSRQYGL